MTVLCNLALYLEPSLSLRLFKQGWHKKPDPKTQPGQIVRGYYFLCYYFSVWLLLLYCYYLIIT